MHTEFVLAVPLHKYIKKEEEIKRIFALYSQQIAFKNLPQLGWKNNIHSIGYFRVSFKLQQVVISSYNTKVGESFTRE